jgi:hypothetical protein
MEECKDAKGDAEVEGGELPIAKTDIGVAELQLFCWRICAARSRIH